MTEEFPQTPPTSGPFFRFPDESTWLTAARNAGFMSTVPVYDEEDNETGTEEKLTDYTTNYAIDVIGTIIEGGEWDEDGNEVTPPTVLPGYHVNYQGDLPAGWDQYVVEPQNPIRVWA